MTTAANSTPPPLPELFLTVAETARLLRVSKMTVYRLIEEGTLTGVPIGPRNLRVSRASVKAIVGDVWPD